MTHAAPMTIRICHLYPRLLSVAGDRGNLLVLMQRCAWRGIRSSVAEADVGVVPDFTQFDLILFHGGQDCEMKVAARDLQAKGGPFREAIEAGAVVLAVCAGYQLLAKYYAPAAGPPITGMGVLDAVLTALAREADLEWLMIDSTIVRAHQHAAGARRQKGGRMPRALAGLAGA